ncbi:M13 family metallopeptidase [Kangiella aquimarina]|uniref:M13 family metallopeptidase n=1 Tax=Kangiella aquimarina TaxID=261965 RepID=A0ABZ0X329_9GAMM|nr:M13 family metallopeptidase [Kangiella aquimarina]WQG84998.1 M13 family metallopeptidase [Kangiella aquimarina]
MKKLLISSVCLAVLAACNSGTDEQKANQEAAKQEVAEQTSNTATQAEQKLVSGIDKAHFDTSVRPQDDLFRHVNGKWLNEFEIPADKSNYGAFTMLAEQAREDVNAIIEEAANSNAEQGSDAQKVGDLYQSYMNEELLEELGTKPLQPELEKIAAIENLSDLSEYIAYAQMISEAPFSTYVYVDAKEPDTYITQMSQNGLGLPSRDFYLKEDEKSEEIRQKYVEHMENMFELAGVKNGAEKAKTVMEIEMQIAEKHWPKEKLRNPVARYNKMSFEELQNTIPNLDWERWSKTAMLEGIDNVIVGQPDYFAAVNDMLKEVSIDDWKTYYQWHLISDSARFLNKAIAEESFRFNQGVLSGVEEQEPRWKRAVNVINGTLGEVVGKIYVEKHFKPEAKERMKELVENLRTAYAQGIKELDWMGEETKKQALDKLAKFTPKIGYPDKWKDYSALEIKADDLFGNMKRATMVEVKRNREKLGQPIDRTEWFMTPQTVNAYYNPVMNEIVFPAAILQPPFFNMEADDAVNYGGIGAVIGHEMGHGFDDSGSQYDGDGKLRNWWTEEDLEEFTKRTDKLVAQYSDFTVLDGVHVNGEFTQGENIGDLGGLTIAYKAYQISKNGEPAPVIDGMTGDQRVFYGWAQVWRRKYRDEELRKRIDTDPHSPSEFRANGTVMNMPEFHEAFDVKPGDKMYLKPEERVKIW